MAKQGKPNILVLWGDDFGQFNISAYNRSMMPKCSQANAWALIFNFIFGESA